VEFFLYFTVATRVEINTLRNLNIHLIRNLELAAWKSPLDQAFDDHTFIGSGYNIAVLAMLEH